VFQSVDTFSVLKTRHRSQSVKCTHRPYSLTIGCRRAGVMRAALPSVSSSCRVVNKRRPSLAPSDLLTSVFLTRD